jgi:hypothetical protein
MVMMTVLALAGSVQGGDKTTADSKLVTLDRFAGEWVVEGKWSNGQTLHARAVYEWSLGKKIMTAKSYVKDGDKEYQRYESILAWHPEKKSLYIITFAFDGSISEVLIENTDKDTLHIGWLPYTEGKPSKVRQVIRFLDKDRFQWIVSIQDGENWQQLIDATWKRKVK